MVKQHEIDISALRNQIDQIKKLVKPQERYRYFGEGNSVNAGSQQETFEQVLQAEMRGMKTAFESKVEMLNTTILNVTEEAQRRARHKDDEIQSLKQINASLCQRLQAMLYFPSQEP